MKRQLEKEVLSPWERCIRKCIPEQLSAPRIILQKGTNELTVDEELLISIFEQVVKDINHFITTNHLFLLTDPSGSLLAEIGTKTVLQMARTLSIGIGTSFSEESIGTNAISLAIKLKQPVYLFPEQHYCDFFKKWYCYAIPLDVGGEIKGYLDISTIEHKMQRELIAITKLIVGKIINEYISASFPKTNGEVKLNTQQLIVLKLLSQGLTAEAAALEIGISINTVKYHKKKIFKELGVQSIGEAVARAINSGLI
jgi:transcriptional regulator of acetoin/glycerol metabolism